LEVLRCWLRESPPAFIKDAFDYVDAPIIRIAQKEVPLPYNRALEQSALPQVPDIVAAVKEVMK
jgi:pyruvate/2-oxoglutarate/acetoin dehydrogenase E1 component